MCRSALPTAVLAALLAVETFTLIISWHGPYFLWALGLHVWHHHMQSYLFFAIA